MFSKKDRVVSLCDACCPAEEAAGGIVLSGKICYLCKLKQ